MGKNNQSGFHLLVTALVVLVLGVLAFAGYKVFSSEPKAAAPAVSKKETTKTVAKNTETNKEQAVTAPTAAQLENIEASITSGNTAALEGYMAASVNVILAASEAYGPQTPTQAVSDVDYVSAGTSWDFNLSDAAIAAYAAGDYKQYFPEGVLVGKSANNYLIAFQFDNAGKIDGIFMTNHADSL